MNFLYVGDVHESDDIPSSRIDDFEQTKIKKIDEINRIANKHKVKAILQGGDFLSKPTLKSQFVSELLSRWLNCDLSKIMFDLLSLKDKEGTDSLINATKECTPLIGVVGNHELYGGNLRTLPKTTIQFLNNIGFLQFATKENPIIFKTEDGLTVAITGTHYHTGMDKPENINDYVVEEKLGDIHIHIVHGMLMNKSVGDLYRHTLIDDVAKLTKADLTISGHDHLGFPLTEIDGKYFVNPGSPFRTSASLKEMKRKPKVLLISITKEKGLKIKSIYLKSAEKGEDVLSRSKIEEQIQRKEKLEEIKSVVVKADVEKGIDIKDIIENIADNNNLSEKIKNEVVDEITEKMEEMDSSNKVSCDDYYITELALKNFQSHVDTVIELDKGLNVFIGESRQGKTSILRAFDFVIENRYKGNVRKYITQGADRCEVSLKLSNGYIITRIVERKSNGINGYTIFNPKTGELEELNTKGVTVVQELLGFSKLNIDKDLSVPLNFLRQGESWFLIGDKYTAPQREKIIGGIFGTHYADAVIRNYEKKERVIGGTLKTKKEDKENLEKELDKYSNLDNLEIILNKIEAKQKEIELLNSEIKTIQDLKDKRDNCISQINQIDETLKKISNLEILTNNINELLEKSRELNTIIELNNRRLNIIEKGQSHKKIIEQVKSINEIKETLSNVKNINEEIKTIQEYKEKLLLKSNLEKNALNLNNVLTRIGDLNILKDKLNSLKETELDFENILEINKKRNDIILSGKQVKQNIEKNKNDLTNKVHEYKEVLLRENTCPVCSHEISEGVINRIIGKLL